MILPLASPGLSLRHQLAAEQIHAIQSPTSRIEPEDGDSMFVGFHARRGNHSATSKDQPATTVNSYDHRRTLDHADLQVPRLVLHPAQIPRTIEIADLTRFASRHDCIRGPEVVHPLPTQLDRFIVRCSPRSLLRCLSHRSRVHPSSDNRSIMSQLPTWPDVVGGAS